MNFILASGQTKYTNKEAIVLYTKNDYSIFVCAIISYKSFEDKPNNFNIVSTMDSNKQVVKMLYMNKKGVYYKGGGQYTNQDKSRVYLTIDERMELLYYKNHFHREEQENGK